MLKKYGRKFTFAACVFIFVILSIALFTFLLLHGSIEGRTFEKLYIVASGLITLLATSYFFANSQAKKFYNEDVDKLRKTVTVNKIETDKTEKQVEENREKIENNG